MWGRDRRGRPTDGAIRRATRVVPAPSSTDREILRLAVPAFLALVAEPAFLLIDSAVVGRLGTVPLAGLGVASAALTSAVGVFVFLAYGTTAAVSRRLGAGDRAGAIGLGVDGLWLAAGIGLAAGALLLVLAPQVAGAFGASAAAVQAATTYLRISAAGLPAMLVLLAATGVLRGLQDTRTPLAVSVAGFSLNAVLNVVLVLGVGMGIAGSALGTVLAQNAMALALAWVVVRGVRGSAVRLRPHPLRVLAAARDGAPLMVRTVALRAALLLTTAVAARAGDATLAAHQVAMTVWGFLAFALDALAIAGQALTGRVLGAGDEAAARAMTARMLRWGVAAGAVLGLGVLAVAPVLPGAFSGVPEVRTALTAALVVVALGQPLSGWVFVLDGVLIGAGDARWLARAQVGVLLAYLPMLLAVRVAHGGIVAVWCAFTGFMLARGVALGWRERSGAWAVTGATR